MTGFKEEQNVEYKAEKHTGLGDEQRKSLDAVDENI